MSAHAQITVNNGDLLLGFQDATNSITFDMGSIEAGMGTTTTAGTALINDLGTGNTVDLGFNVNTALSYTGSTGAKGYGTTWATSGNVSWGVAAYDGANFFTGMTESNPSSTIAGAPAVANSTLISIGDATAAGNSLGTLIAAMGTSPGTAQLKAGGSTVLAIKYLNTSNSSFSHIDPNTSASAFGGTFTPSAGLNVNTTTDVTGSSGLLNGKTYSVLDLYEYTNSGSTVTATLLGNLELTTGGELFFTAIPEPSTYTMILGVFALGFVMLRRRHQVTA